MIPHVTPRTVSTGGSTASVSFEISQRNASHIMGILHEGLYSDAILAVLREYGANAWDAHKSIGLGDTPISVTLPTQHDLTLRIRDYGPGLSHEDVFTVFNQYGESTKRDTDDAVGCLGIGSKSGFAYGDSFIIVSWHDGTRRTYCAVLDESNAGRIDLLDETALDGEAAGETGIEIQIAVKPGDVYRFERTARELFRHYRPRPSINIELPAPPVEQTVLTHGVIMPGHGEWIAIMGCVPYRVSLGQLPEREANKCLPNLSGELHFAIGEIAHSSSREDVKYNERTKAALVAKFNALVDEFVLQALTKLEAGAFSGWDTRLQVQVLAKLELPLPEKWKAYAEGFAKVTYSSDDFTILHGTSVTTRLMVTAKTTLLIDDTGLSLTGYMFGHDDYVVRSQTKTATELRTTLDAAIATSGLTGVRIELLSSRHWIAPYVKPKRVTNPKHRARMFRLVDSDHDKGTKWSDNWEAVTRIPLPEDVYVVIEGFRCVDNDNFFRDYAADVWLAEQFGETVPEVYGYKSTAAKPVDKAATAGTEYRAWRESFVKGLLTPDRIAQIALYWRANMTSSHSRYGYDEVLPAPDTNERKRLISELGDAHPLVDLYERQRNAKRVIGDKANALRKLADRTDLSWSASEAKVALEAVRKRYPLLRRAGLDQLWNGDKDEQQDWLDYVRLCDVKHDGVTNNVVQLKSVP